MHKKGRVNCLEVLVLLYIIIDFSIKLYRIIIILCQQSEKGALAPFSLFKR